jgi:hypothetical protein
MTVGDLLAVLNSEGVGEPVQVKIVGEDGDFDIVAVSVRRTATKEEPAPVVLIVRRKPASTRA